MQGLLLLNKPKGMTSFSAVSYLKRASGEKRIGHTGTLDPMATGVLPILFGKATSLSNFLLDGDKRYTAKIKLGITTDTDDVTGSIISQSKVNITPEQLEDALRRFTGKISQRPPMYSAIKRDGVRLYELARAGKTVDISSREIEIYEIKLLSPLDSENTFTVDVHVSKGTYIRSLARDIGEYLGCGATLAELERTYAGGFDISSCVDLKEITQDNITDFIQNEEKAVEYLQSVGVTDKQAVRFCNGGQLDLKRLKDKSFKANELVRVRYGNQFLGVGIIDREKGELSIKCVINKPDFRHNAVALGTFDGLHAGHRRVLNLPQELRKVAVTFEKPPKMILSGESELIMSYGEKYKALKNMGIDEVLKLDFYTVKDKNPCEFLEFICERYNPSMISCGFNYHFGKNGEGDTQLLSRFCEEKGITLRICEEFRLDGETVSSTRIRNLLRQGEIQKANRLLSEPYSFKAVVEHGDERGRTIGFPTINQKYPRGRVRLKNGVYKTKIYYKNKEYNGITNIGIRPTYELDYIISETYIIDFKGDLYGKTVTVKPVSFLREEMKFSNVEELKNQILKDIEQGEKYEA